MFYKQHVYFMFFLQNLSICTNELLTIIHSKFNHLKHIQIL